GSLNMGAEDRRVGSLNMSAATNQTTPAIFFGHGNPMNALQDNDWTAAWAAIGKSIPRPRAVLCVSAHWYLPATLVTAMSQPRTIHDFGGFPRELYQVQYRAPGSAELARRVHELLAPLPVELDQSWGLDHGTWSVLRHVYPSADVPVVQLSMDETQPPAFHFELGKRLATLRDEQVLIVGSGNLVHNLHTYAWGRHTPEPYDWAVRFEEQAKELMTSAATGADGANFDALINYDSLGHDALLAIPTPDHYLPVLYVLGATRPHDQITFPVQGIDGGSVSMLTVQVG
ncbi:MAG TPA: 4,5-DOPA dioxygenase extradiol, partial [Pyrinomonadaceae bacterium]|nr:4,5-DOPA dioxygenase extradiol [Pyrinomonadaceae bacterium]